MNFASLSNILCLICLVPFSKAAPVVQLGDTLITGAVSPLSPLIETFKGIPYAQPPLGQLRFQAPVLQTSLNGTAFSALEFGAACLQINPLIPRANQSEDCLTLNVFRPAGSEDALLPVMVWIFGGGFVNGASLLYDGSYLVNKSIERGTPMIFASFDYRLAQLGFSTGEEAAAKGGLNVGLKDQLAAFKWINTNIAAFGGDKDKVTIAGESAGAQAVDIHLHGAALKDLARGAILQSSYGRPIDTPPFGNAAWATYVSAIPECASTANTSDTFTCLRQPNTTTDSLYNALGAGGAFIPVLDNGTEGAVLPDFLSQLPLSSGLPSIIGSNLDEGTEFTDQDISSSEAIRQFIIQGSSPSPRGQEALQSAANTIVDLYPNIPSLGSPYGTGNDTFGLAPEYKQFAAFFGDYWFQAHNRRLANNLSDSGTATFSYQFADHDSRFPPGLSTASPESHGVSHANELAFFGYFGPLASPALNITSPTAFELSEKMKEYWISFVASLDPNDGKGSERLEWPRYDSTNKEIIQLDGKNLTTVPAYRAEQMAFISQDPLIFRQ